MRGLRARPWRRHVARWRRAGELLRRESDGLLLGECSILPSCWRRILSSPHVSLPSRGSVNNRHGLNLAAARIPGQRAALPPLHRRLPEDLPPAGRAGCRGTFVDRRQRERRPVTKAWANAPSATVGTEGLQVSATDVGKVSTRRAPILWKEREYDFRQCQSRSLASAGDRDRARPATMAHRQSITLGIPSRYPNIKVINSHLGGALPMLLQRADNTVRMGISGYPGAAQRCRAAHVVRHRRPRARPRAALRHRIVRREPAAVGY